MSARCLTIVRRLSQLVLLWAVSGTASWVMAQEPAAVNCRIRTLGWENVPAELYLATRSGYERISVDPLVLSDYYPYRGAQTLAVSREIPRVAQGTPPPSPIATVTLDQGNQDYILLVLPLDGAGHLSIKAVPDSTTRLSEGSLTLINVTPAMLGVRVGDENREVPPLQPRQVPLPKPDQPDRRRQRIQLQVYWKSPEGWEMLRTVFIFVPKGSNELMFFHQPVWSDGMNSFVKDPIQWTTVGR